MALGNKLYNDIGTLQKKSGYDFNKNRSDSHTIISVNTKTTDNCNPEGLIKTASIDLSSGKLIYTLTSNVEEAMKFDSIVSNMLYHYIKDFAPEILTHSHHPIANIR